MEPCRRGSARRAVADHQAGVRRRDGEALVGQPLDGEDIDFIVGRSNGRTLGAGAEDGRLADLGAVDRIDLVAVRCRAVMGREVTGADAAQVNAHALAVAIHIHGQDGAGAGGVVQRTLLGTLVHGNSPWVWLKQSAGNCRPSYITREIESVNSQFITLWISQNTTNV